MKNEKFRSFLGQINLANADCITRLRELLLTTDNSTTKCKVLLALNNLALNDFAITQFSVRKQKIFNNFHLICRRGRALFQQ